MSVPEEWRRKVLLHALHVAVYYGSRSNFIISKSVEKYGPKKAQKKNVLSHASHVAADVLFSDTHLVLRNGITFESVLIDE